MEIIKVIILWILIDISIILVIIEITNILVNGYHFIHGNGVNLLIEELDVSTSSILSSMIDLKGKSRLNAQYISNSMSTLIFPYIIRCGELGDKRTTYMIIRWTKSYYLIKDKYKELYPKKKNKPKIH